MLSYSVDIHIYNDVSMAIVGILYPLFCHTIGVKLHNFLLEIRRVHLFGYLRVINVFVNLGNIGKFHCVP